MTTIVDAFDAPAANIRPYRLLLALGRHLQAGQLHLVLPDGGSYRFSGTRPGPVAKLRVRSPRFLRRVLLGGDIGFAEAYMDGDCDSPDLRALVELALANAESWERLLEGVSFWRLASRLRDLARPNNRFWARRNIARHYDLGNAFYEAWLDPGMAYSAAVFERPDQPLEEAQTAKYRRIAERARLAPSHHLLEIGCGWGGFAIFAAREIGCRVTAITLSAAQHANALRRVREAGLEDRVTVLLRDYRDIQGRFDRIVSIEMLEAVGERYWPVYMRKLSELLAPGGVAALQVITIDDALWPSYRRGVDFIRRYIFPGGLLPAMSVLRDEAARAGLACRDEGGYGQDYALTLAYWHRRFDAAWPRIARLGFDERFRRMWKFYLAYCEGGFRLGRIDVKQFALVKS